MNKILTLGDHYVSDFIKPGQPKREEKKWSLDLYLEYKDGAVRLKDPVPPKAMYGKYWYRSGINGSMTKQLGNIVNEICDRITYKKGDVWLDIACNDGTLLRQVPDEFCKVGIDPADDSYLVESTKVATVVQDFFSRDAYERSGHGGIKPKVITCIAMFYDIENREEFLKDVYDILDDDGVFVLQMSYTPLMLHQLAFDNICHEHLYYYDLNSLDSLFSRCGFVLRDCNLNDTNGGSFRVYFQKNTSDENKFMSRQMRDVCWMRCQSIMCHENKKYCITDPEVWSRFGMRIQNLKKETLEFLEKAKKEGKIVYGYGASTKGNTLLQIFGITEDLLPAIAERNPEKVGCRTIGSDIPIISEDQMRRDNPHYLLVLPWHFIDEFVKREYSYLNGGGKLVVPCPTFKIIGE